MVDESTRRCRYCGFLYYAWKLPAHETICSMRPIPAGQSGLALSPLPDEDPPRAPGLAKLPHKHWALVEPAVPHFRRAVKVMLARPAASLIRACTEARRVHRSGTAPRGDLRHGFLKRLPPQDGEVAETVSLPRDQLASLELARFSPRNAVTPVENPLRPSGLCCRHELLRRELCWNPAA